MPHCGVALVHHCMTMVPMAALNTPQFGCRIFDYMLSSGILRRYPHTIRHEPRLMVAADPNFNVTPCPHPITTGCSTGCSERHSCISSTRPTSPTVLYVTGRTQAAHRASQERGSPLHPIPSASSGDTSSGTTPSGERSHACVFSRTAPRAPKGARPDTRDSSTTFLTCRPDVVPGTPSCRQSTPRFSSPVC